jgi:hypothetical protein
VVESSCHDSLAARTDTLVIAMALPPVPEHDKL